MNNKRNADLNAVRLSARDIKEGFKAILNLVQAMNPSYETIREEMQHITPMTDEEKGMLEVLRYKPGENKLKNFIEAAEILEKVCERRTLDLFAKDQELNEKKSVAELYDDARMGATV